jgi:hypothetical protein
MVPNCRLVPAHLPHTSVATKPIHGGESYRKRHENTDLALPVSKIFVLVQEIVSPCYYFIHNTHACKAKHSKG